ncbi:MAG: DUF5698 domain-containing protein [bacterium]|nr:DUF5698 domain-containing protein [bacterium]
MTTEALITAGIIFVLRVVNNAVGTVRLVTLARGQRWITAVLGFFEALVFAVTISGVVTDLSNILNLVAYCGGFSVGAWVGMIVEARFVKSFVIINIFTNEKGHEIALALREKGYGVTEMGGQGRAGEVSMLRSVAGSRDVSGIMAVIRSVHPEAFVAVEQARSVQGGWLRAPTNQPR